MKKVPGITDFEGCQLQCIPKFEAAPAKNISASPLISAKRLLAYPWNSYIRKWLKKIYYSTEHLIHKKGYSSVHVAAGNFRQESVLKKGDVVRVRSLEQIKSTLDPFNELKGCSFLPEMNKYCDTEQRIYKSMQYFLDERDYKIKKTRGIILLEDITCTGTPVFGPCDRSCFLFWREEWLEKVERI
jgi:hypothetical protein